MKRVLTIFAVLALLAGTTQAQDLRKLNLDDASVIGLTISGYFIK